LGGKGGEGAEEGDKKSSFQEKIKSGRKGTTKLSPAPEEVREGQFAKTAAPHSKRDA